MHENQNEKGYDDPQAQRDQDFKRLCILDENGHCHRGDYQHEAGHHYYVKSRVAIIHVSNT